MNGSSSTVSAVRRLWRPLLALCLLALVIRVVVVLATPQFVPIADSHEYDASAVSLVDRHTFAGSTETFHGGPTASHPPLFPIALAGVYAVVGTGSEKGRWEAGRMFEAVLGTVTVALVALIVLRLWGAVPALVAGAMAAVYPPLVLVGSSLLTESLFIPLALGAVLIALIGRDAERPWHWALAAGVLAGLAALTRETGLVLAVGLCLLAWTGSPRLSRRALLAPSLVLAATVLVLVPWTVRNASLFHRFEPVTTGTGYALAGAYDHEAQSSKRFPAKWQAPFLDVDRVLQAEPRANEAEISSRLTGMAWHYISEHPGAVLKTAYWSTRRLLGLSGPGFERTLAPYEGYPRWLAGVSVYAFWLLAALAIAGACTAAARRVPRALWACPALMFLASVPFDGSARYRSPADPFVLMLAALALLAVAGRWIDRARVAR